MLNPDQRRIFWLYYSAKLRQHEIASIFKVSQAAISKRLRRIREALRRRGIVKASTGRKQLCEMAEQFYGGGAGGVASTGAADEACVALMAALDIKDHRDFDRQIEAGGNLVPVILALRKWHEGRPVEPTLPTLADDADGAGVEDVLGIERREKPIEDEPRPKNIDPGDADVSAWLRGLSPEDRKALAGEMKRGYVKPNRKATEGIGARL